MAAPRIGRHCSSRVALTSALTRTTPRAQTLFRAAPNSMSPPPSSGPTSRERIPCPASRSRSRGSRRRRPPRALSTALAVGPPTYGSSFRGSHECLRRYPWGQMEAEYMEWAVSRSRQINEARHRRGPGSAPTAGRIPSHAGEVGLLWGRRSPMIPPGTRPQGSPCVPCHVRQTIGSCLSAA